MYVIVHISVLFSLFIPLFASNVKDTYFHKYSDVMFVENPPAAIDFIMRRKGNNRIKCGGMCMKEKMCIAFDVCSVNSTKYCRVWTGSPDYGITGEVKHCQRYQGENCEAGMVFDGSIKACIKDPQKIKECPDCECISIYTNISGVYPVTRAGLAYNFSCLFENEQVWTIIQRRVDGTTDFYRGWQEYENGFGSPGHEFWLGNRLIHELTQNGSTFLRIDMYDADTSEALWATYDNFYIDGPEQKYTLHFSGFNGNAGDSLDGTLSTTGHNGLMFTTKDQDNDLATGNCAQQKTGAWWYGSCYRSNLNGLYGSHGTGDGIVWWSYKNGNDNSMEKVTMMIRRP